MPRTRNTLMPTVVIILSCGFIVTSLISYFVSRESLKTEITNSSLPLTSDNIYSEIQRDLLQPVFISSLMARDTFVRDWVIKGERDDTEIAHYLAEIKSRYGTVSCFFVSDRTGNYYHTGGILKRVSASEKRDEWYYRVKGMSEDFEINIDPDLANKDTMTIFINYRVFDYDKGFIGVTGVGLAVSSVKRLIGEYQEKYGRNIFFIDPNGAIMLRGTSIPEGVTSIDQIEGLRDYAAEILKEKGGTYSYTRNHAKQYLNTRYIKEFNWILLVEEDERNATLALLRSLIVNMLISLAVTLIIFFLLRARINSYQKKIEHLAATDKLTGLYNRQAFDLLMAQALKERNRSDRSLAAIMIDLDLFKTVNDTWGHLAGDAVLTQAAERLQKGLRETDSLCRWGGEEFLILLRDCSPEDAAKTAEKLRASFAEAPFRVGEIEVPLTISAGTTSIEKDDSYETATARADQALYGAKAGGRNLVVTA